MFLQSMTSLREPITHGGSQVRWSTRLRKLLVAFCYKGTGLDSETVTRASVYHPQAIPPGFWDRADVRRALRNRDMSARFQLAEESAGLSRTRLGVAAGPAPARRCSPWT